MKPFHVIIGSNGEFRSYDIMGYLVDKWFEFCEKAEIFQEEPEDFWKIPTNKEEYKKWVDLELKYQFWSRYEYELILEQYPPNNKKERIDIYWQCQLNMDLIVDIFIENISYKN